MGDEETRTESTSVEAPDGTKVEETTEVVTETESEDKSPATSAQEVVDEVHEAHTEQVEAGETDSE